MNASPAWLEGMARGAAGRDLLRRERPEPAWGQPRFSRRRVVGTATSTMVAASALRFVSPAFAQAPPCLSPCLKDAGADFAAKMNRIRRIYESRLSNLENALDDLKVAKRKAKSAKGRAKIQRQIDANLRSQLGYLNGWRDFQGGYEGDLFEKKEQCKSDAQCGDPEKYPGGQAPPGSGTGQCGDPSAACGELCCSSGSRCCGGCKICCIDDVSCKDCCPA